MKIGTGIKNKLVPIFIIPMYASQFPVLTGRTIN